MGLRERRDRIRELLAGERFASQAVLLRRLETEGFAATQPMLSRDLAALGAGKVEGAYRVPERVTPLDHLASLLRGAEPAGPHLLVVRCEPGAASAIARALEAEELAGLVGTVAGDDTIFLALEAPRFAKGIQKRILALIP